MGGASLVIGLRPLWLSQMVALGRHGGKFPTRRFMRLKCNGSRYPVVEYEVYLACLKLGLSKTRLCLQPEQAE